MSEISHVDEYNSGKFETEVIDPTDTQLGLLYGEITENEEGIDESIEIIGVSNRIDYGIEQSLQFNRLARQIISESERATIKQGITRFFKQIAYQEGTSSIVYDTDAKITSAINGFLTSDIRSKVANNWDKIQMEQVIKSVVGRTINYPKNKYTVKKKQSDGKVVSTTPDAVRTNIIDSFKSVLGI